MLDFNSNDYKYRYNEVTQLCKEIGLNEDSIMIEVGSYNGVSACIFGSIVKTVYCVDIFNSSYEFDQVMEYNNSLKPDNIVKLVGRSDDMYKHFCNEYADFVYIDADHNYSNTMKDILHWTPKVKIGGHIGGHDYIRNETRDRESRMYSQGDVFEVIHDIFNDEVGNVNIDWFVKKDINNKYIQKICSKSIFQY